MRYDIFKSDIGHILIAGNESGLSLLSFQDGTDPVMPHTAWKRDPGFIHPVKEQLTAYFNSELKEFNLRLNPAGTPFQIRVWDELLKIPYGKTLTYQDIAVNAGSPAAARAAGLACGKNPIPIIIPCHRVIGKNGKLTGYSSGLDIKKRLLHLEGVPTPEI